MTKHSIGEVGIDRMISRFGADAFAKAVGLSPRTIAKWRKDDPRGALYKIAARVGGQAELARRLGMPQTTVNQWIRWDCPQPAAKPEPKNGVERAVQLAGGQPQMARALGVTQQNVSVWVRQGYVPASRAREIEIEYGVPRIELLSPKIRSAAGLGGDL